jgi:hypothetical protein
MKIGAAIDEAAMFPISFAMRIEMRRRRGLSRSLAMTVAEASFSSFIFWSRKGPRENSATSDPEKKAQRKRKRIMRDSFMRMNGSMSVS